MRGTVLVGSPRHKARDLARWALDEQTDVLVGQRTDWSRLLARSLGSIRDFAAEGPCYAGVSWGKDSVVIAHLIQRLAPEVVIPLVWVRIAPRTDPDCARVRDAFLSAHPHPYSELVGEWIPNAPVHPKIAGFRVAAALVGADRYVSGVRGAESGERKRRMMRFGVSTQRTCAPIGWWSTAQVFAYLWRHNLPVHPAYACTNGGMWPRERIRVGSIGGPRGQGHGRAEWERIYYPDVVRAVAQHERALEALAR